MQYEETGRIIRAVGGLFEVALDAGETPLSGRLVAARAKGNFRHAGVTPLPGDRVRLSFGEVAVALEESASADGGDAVIAEIMERKNALIRPPMANLDVLFVTLAAADPAPVPETVDKLISIAEFNRIEPVLIVTKSDVAPEAARAFAEIYERAGFHVFLLSAKAGDGIDALRSYMHESMTGRIAAFAGASGVGKSTLLNALFPSLSLQTGEISHKIARGKHTTRRVQLYPMDGAENAYIADTPGFSMLDFVRFDFFKKEDLPETMREFLPFIGECRYTKCSHTKDEGCAILQAVRDGVIPQTRHDSYCAMYEALKNKHDWSKK